MNESADSQPVTGARTAERTRRVLVVDDEADLRELLELTLVGMGLDVDCVGSLADAERLLARQAYALCLTDMRLPDGDGLALVAAINSRYPQTPVAVITAYGSAENAVAALKAGAFDYLAKPVALDALRSLVRSAVQLPGQQPAVRDAAAGTADDPTRQLLGGSAAMNEVRAQIQRLARSMAPVSIAGESGSGKELAARLIHQSGPRAAQPFVAVNCGAIPEALMEAEFFGYRKGAFTGADQDRDGFFQAASGGTLFLDEVADLPLAMQVKLLRAIQEKRVRKVGATVEGAVDVRIVSATHQDLAQCVASGRFRQDLFYRLNVIELKLPALRDRLDDIPALAGAIIERLAARAGMAQAPRLASVTLRYLQSYRFPGNVRELENMLERALDRVALDLVEVVGQRLGDSFFGYAHRPTFARLRGLRIALGDRLGALALVGVGDGRLQAEVFDVDHLAVAKRQRALEKTRYNRTAAARLLGITFRALRYRMQRLGLN